jgi:hypothetical protein
MITSLNGPTSVAFVLSLAAVPAAAQNQLWIHQFGSYTSDVTSAVASDGSGGVYVSGFTSGSLGGPNAGAKDAYLARYDSAGSMLWIRQLGASADDAATASAPDGAGGVYTSGTIGSSLSLARYDNAGNQLWILQFGSTGGSDRVTAADPDGAGGVYLSGWTTGSFGGPFNSCTDAWLARYDSAGNQLWIRQFGLGSCDYAFAAVGDGAAGVYVSGSTFSYSGPYADPPDGWLARYDTAGTQLWIRQLATSGYDSADAVVTDGAGGVYLSGNTLGSLAAPNAGSGDVWLARYDSSGTQTWIQQFGTSDFEVVNAAATDGAGGLYLSGYTNGSFGGPHAGEYDAWLGRYDSAGNEIWIGHLGTSKDDVSYAAAPDGSGGAYVGGRTKDSLGGPSAGVGWDDAWVARYESPCGASSYCTASTTSIPGCKAAINAAGSPSFSNPNSFTISSGSVPGGILGFCFFGDSGASSIPFGTLGGQLCVQSPFYYSAPKTSGGSVGSCDGDFSFTLQELINASPIIVSGAVIRAQIWARDRENGDGFLMSDGLRITVCP